MSISDAILVTGGAGFIGSNFVHEWLAAEGTPVINLDRLTYAGNLQNLESLEGDLRHEFVHGSINDRTLLDELLHRCRPRAIVHFAAETHVDRSIYGPDDFIQTNINGTFELLHAARAYWCELEPAERERFRCLHVSTDEVYGSLGLEDPAFTEASPYRPNSPYAASKAASDHLVRAYHHTYGLPTLITNCSNNYGPRQFPEKLIPLMITSALQGKLLPVYGDGLNIRDWLFVGDHCKAIRAVLAHGRPGETYNIGGDSEKSNLDVVRAICRVLQQVRPVPGGYEVLITFVEDRPGHDRRYAMNCCKLRRELGWAPRETFDSGLRQTISWYLENTSWVENVTSGAYQRWLQINYATRRQHA